MTCTRGHKGAATEARFQHRCLGLPKVWR
jgi:hypothetical protein